MIANGTLTNGELSFTKSIIWCTRYTNFPSVNDTGTAPFDSLGNGIPIVGGAVGGCTLG